MFRAPDLRREQVRGLFVLGFLAIILVIRDSFKIRLLADFTVLDMMNLLLLYWGTYAFLMALGLSPDIFKKNFAWGCATVARFLFYIGAVLMFYLLVTAFISLLLSLIAPASPPLLPYVLGFLGSIPALMTHQRRGKLLPLRLVNVFERAFSKKRKYRSPSDTSPT